MLNIAELARAGRGGGGRGHSPYEDLEQLMHTTNT